MDNPSFIGVEILNNVHDSLVVQISYEKVPLIKHADAIKMIVDSLQSNISFRGMTFSIPADVAVGLTLDKKKMKKVPINKYSTATELLHESLQKISEELLHDER
jgi:hypothetical protein